MTRHFSRFAIGLLTAGLLALPTWAQFRVEVSGVGLTQVPIAFAPLRGEETSPQKISTIVQADLERSGQFRGVTAGVVTDETQRPDISGMRQKGADALLTGSISRMADGRYDVRVRLWDVVRGQDLGAMSYVVVTGDLRLASHKISDFVYEKLTGDKGVFSTRIAYVTKAGSRYNLWVADSDGENAQSALASPEPIISPSWSPLGGQLAYVSFESRKPVVYIHDVSTGKRRVIANFRGSNSAPSWSPDGRSLAVTLSRDGGSQLFAIDANGGEPRRLTQSAAIDTEPVFSPDGTAIYFVSDRGGASDLPHASLGRPGQPCDLQWHLQHFARHQPRWPLVDLHLTHRRCIQAARDGHCQRQCGRHHRQQSRRAPQLCPQQPFDCLRNHPRWP